MATCLQFLPPAVTVSIDLPVVLIAVLAIIMSGLFAWLSHLRMKMVEAYLAEIVAWLDEGEDPPPDDGEELPENVLKLRRSI